MRLVKQKVDVIRSCHTDMEGIYKHIEIAARTCKQTIDGITPNSAERMVKMLIDRKHYGMLRHGTIYLTIPNSLFGGKNVDKYKANAYTMTKKRGSATYITTNYLVLHENGWWDDLKYISDDIEHHHKRTTIQFTTSIAIAREIQTHDGKYGRARAELSTRYCNFSKDKFGNMLTFVIPQWCSLKEGIYEKKNKGMSWVCDDKCIHGDLNMQELLFLNSLQHHEDSYLAILGAGLKPEESRDLLPLSTKTELVYTLFDADWQHVFNVRGSGKGVGVHPMMREIMDAAQYQLNINRV